MLNSFQHLITGFLWKNLVNQILRSSRPQNDGRAKSDKTSDIYGHSERSEESINIDPEINSG